MKSYVVVAAKPVEARIGTMTESKRKTFNQGEEFKTLPEFVVDLIELGYVAEAGSDRKAPENKTLKRTEGAK